MVQEATSRPAPAPAPRPGEELPEFSLVSSRGVRLGPATYKRRRNLAIVFTHGADCARCAENLRGLAAMSAGFVEEDAEALIVAEVTAEGAKEIATRLGLPFAVLADADGVVHARYGVTRGTATFVANRYGEVRERWLSAGDHDQQPRPDDVVGWLRLIEMECPE